MTWYWNAMDGWDPLREMRRLQREVNRVFGDFAAAPEAYPAVNLWADAEKAVLTAEIPGADPKDLDISVKDDVLTLKGNRKKDEVAEGVVCHRCEREAGPFVRTLRLPFAVDPAHVKAVQRRGVLSVTLPRAEATKPRQIKVETA